MAKPPSRYIESEAEYERRLLREGWYVGRPIESAERARIAAGIYDDPKPIPTIMQRLFGWLFG